MTTEETCSSITEEDTEAMIDYCTDGSVWARTGCILSYSGSTKDIILNYIMLAINLVWCVIALSLHTQDNMDRSAALRIFAIGALVFGEYVCMYSV